MHPSITRMKRLFPLLAALVIAGVTVSVAFALFTNGGFETGTFTGWTRTHFLNPALSGSPPFTGTNIVRNAGGIDQSAVLGPFPILSQSDPNTGGNLKYPRFGTHVGRVNGIYSDTVSNSIAQTATVQLSDINPLDGQIHVMFAYAPVLQDPGHIPSHQPYFYVAIRNITKNVLLYEKFAFAGEAGVPWQSHPDPTGEVKYTDWQVVDITPGPSNIAIGDSLTIEAIGAGCSEGAHYGYIYVDVFGSSIPGLYAIKKGPAEVYPNSNMVYNMGYWNNSGGTVTNTVIVENIPAKTTFVSADPRCAHTSGVVTCTLGTLSAGVTGTFPITVHVNSGVTGTVNNGNYYIYAYGVPSLLGQLVTTNIIHRAPVANAGPDQSVIYNAAVTLNGSGSTDLDGDLPLTYRWQQTGGPAVVLSSHTISQPTFTAPGTTTVLTFTLTVTDSLGVPSTPDMVRVTVSPPTADLAITQSLRINFLRNLTFVVVARNNGPVAAPGAIVSDTMPSNLLNLSWTCVSAGGATCGTASGSGNIHDTLASFPVGGVVTYTIQANLSEWSSVRNEAQVIVPSPITDPVMSNNTAAAQIYRIFLQYVPKDGMRPWLAAQ